MPASVTPPPAISRLITTALVGLAVVGSGLTYVITKNTTTAAIRQEYIFDVHSSSGSGLRVDGNGNANLSGSLTIGGAFHPASITSSGGLTIEGVPMEQRSVVLPLCDGLNACATGSGAVFIVPAFMNTEKITGALLACGVKGTTNLESVQVINITQNKNLFSTVFSVDSQEVDSSTAATPGVINTTANANVMTTNDLIMPRVDAVHSTPCKASSIRLDFTPQ